jgi:ubiquinone/menaquinone biosynthesis C-methylase UbiE
VGHRFDPKHLHRLDNPERRKALPPDEVLGLLDVQKNMTVADIGCGPGYFTLPLAQMTEREVFALDVSEEMLDVLSDRARQAGASNITPILSPAENIKLADDSVDGLICSLVLHEVDDLSQTLSEFKRILKPGGTMLLVEWDKKPMDIGPPLHIRIAPEELLNHVATLEMAGTVTRPNPNQYIIVAR